MISYGELLEVFWAAKSTSGTRRRRLGPPGDRDTLPAAMADPSFTCRSCGDEFTVKREILEKYDGWTPSVCLPCRDAAKSDEKPSGGSKKRPSGSGKRKRKRKPAGPVESPTAGVFTDGACSGNPGPGGWAAVWVRDDDVVEERYGRDEHTTNNRMELRALIEAYRMLPEGSDETIWSDSNLCVRTLNEWAEGWKRRGWKRKTGPVENLDLVQEAYELHRAHPHVELRWIKGHAGLKWNEHADRLATKGPSV